MIDEQTLMKTIRELRESLGQTQNVFAQTIGRSLPTASRYELLKPPKGFDLIQFFELAEYAGRRDLAEIFGQAVLDTIPEGAAEIARKMPRHRGEVATIDWSVTSAVPNPEQPAPCSRCKSALSETDIPGTEILGSGSVLKLENPEESAGVSGITVEDRAWLKKLVYILRERNPIAVAAVTSNLIAFEDLTRAQQGTISHAQVADLRRVAELTSQALRIVEANEDRDEGTSGDLRTGKGGANR